MLEDGKGSNGHGMKSAVNSELGTFWFRITMILFGLASTILGSVALSTFSGWKTTNATIINRLNTVALEHTEMKARVNYAEVSIIRVEVAEKKLEERFNDFTSWRNLTK